jgi:hypothetical protein
MNISWNGKFHRIVLWCGMLLAVTSSLGAVWVFAIASVGRGSYEENILRAGFGLLLLMLSLLIFGTAAIYFTSSEMRRDTRSGARF